MCDCYYHKCKKCKKELPIHLGDYETEREEIEVFCNKHIPKRNVRVFIVTSKPEYDKEFNKGEKIGIRDLTTNAKKNKEYNEPNIGECELYKVK